VPASQPGGGGKNHRVVKFKMTTTSSFPAPAKRGVCIFEVSSFIPAIAQKP